MLDYINYKLKLVQCDIALLIDTLYIRSHPSYTGFDLEASSDSLPDPETLGICCHTWYIMIGVMW